MRTSSSRVASVPGRATTAHHKHMPSTRLERNLLGLHVGAMQLGSLESREADVPSSPNFVWSVSASEGAWPIRVGDDRSRSGSKAGRWSPGRRAFCNSATSVASPCPSVGARFDRAWGPSLQLEVEPMTGLGTNRTMKKRNRLLRALSMGAICGLVAAGCYDISGGVPEAKALGFGFTAKTKAKLVTSCYPCDSGVKTCNC